MSYYVVKAKLTKDDTKRINSKLDNIDYIRREDHYCALLVSTIWKRELSLDEMKNQLDVKIRVRSVRQIGIAIALILENEKDSYLDRRKRQLIQKIGIDEEELAQIYHPRVIIGFTTEKLDFEAMNNLSNLFVGTTITIDHEVAKIHNNDPFPVWEQETIH